MRSVRSSRGPAGVQLPRRPRSKAASSSFTWGSRGGVFQGYHVAPPAVPYTMRPTRRSMSPMPVRARASSSRVMVWSTSWPTAALAAGDGRYGQQGPLQPAAQHPPAHGGFLVLSSTHREAPLFSLLRRVSVSSRFRRAVRSSSMNCPCR